MPFGAITGICFAAIKKRKLPHKSGQLPFDLFGSNQYSVLMLLSIPEGVNPRRPLWRDGKT